MFEDGEGMRLFITRKGLPIIGRMLPLSHSPSYKYIPTALVRLVVHSCLSLCEVCLECKHRLRSAVHLRPIEENAVDVVS
jgi:hypothetical protein